MILLILSVIPVRENVYQIVEEEMERSVQQHLLHFVVLIVIQRPVLIVIRRLMEVFVSKIIAPAVTSKRVPSVITYVGQHVIRPALRFAILVMVKIVGRLEIVYKEHIFVILDGPFVMKSVIQFQTKEKLAIFRQQPYAELIVDIRAQMMELLCAPRATDSVERNALIP